jgi:hypothetical protein
MHTGHRLRILVSSCLAGLFVRLTVLFVRLADLFVSLAGFWVLEIKFIKLLEMRSFFSPHIILESTNNEI